MAHALNPIDAEDIPGDLCRTRSCFKPMVPGALHCNDCYDRIEEENGLARLNEEAERRFEATRDER
jgi:hypothetical protein